MPPTTTTRVAATPAVLPPPRPAGLCAVVGSFCILAFSLLTSPPAPNAVVVTPRAAYCGTLDTTNGVTFVRLANGTKIPVAGGTMTIVSSCGGS